MGGESIKPIRKRIHVYFLMTTYHFYVGEQERHEGKLHNGKCHVVQFAIQVKK